MNSGDLYKAMKALADAHAGQAVVMVPSELAYRWAALAHMYPGDAVDHKVRQMSLMRLEASFVDAEVNIVRQVAGALK